MDENKEKKENETTDPIVNLPGDTVAENPHAIHVTIDADIEPSKSKLIPMTGLWKVTAKGGTVEGMPMDDAGVLIEPYNIDTLYHAYLRTVQVADKPEVDIDTGGDSDGDGKDDGGGDGESRSDRDDDNTDNIINNPILKFNDKKNTWVVYMSGQPARSYHYYDQIGNTGKKTKRDAFESYMDMYIFEKSALDEGIYPSVNDIPLHVTNKDIKDIYTVADRYLNTFDKYITHGNDIYFKLGPRVLETQDYGTFDNGSLDTLIEFFKIKVAELKGETSDVKYEYRMWIESDDIRYSYFPNYIDASGQHSVYTNPLWLCMAVRDGDDIKLVYIPSRLEDNGGLLKDSKEFYFPVQYNADDFKKPADGSVKPGIYKVSFDVADVLFHALLSFGSVGKVDWTDKSPENIKKIEDYFNDDKKVKADIISLFGTVIPKEGKAIFGEEGKEPSYDLVAEVAKGYTDNAWVKTLTGSATYNLYHVCGMNIPLTKPLGQYGSKSFRYTGNPVLGQGSYRLGKLFDNDIVVHGATYDLPALRTGFCYRFFPVDDIYSYRLSTVKIYADVSIWTTMPSGEIVKNTLDPEKKDDYTLTYYINNRNYIANIPYVLQDDITKEPKLTDVYNRGNVLVMNLDTDGNKMTPVNIVMPLGYQSKRDNRVYNDKLASLMKEEPKKDTAYINKFNEYITAPANNDKPFIRSFTVNGDVTTAINSNLHSKYTLVEALCVPNMYMMNEGYKESDIEYVTATDYEKGTKTTVCPASTSFKDTKVYVYLIDASKFDTIKNIGGVYTTDDELKFGVSWASMENGVIKGESRKTILTKDKVNISGYKNNTPLISVRIYKLNSAAAFDKVMGYISEVKSLKGTDTAVLESYIDYGDNDKVAPGGYLADGYILNKSNIADDSEYADLYNTLKKVDTNKGIYVVAVGIYASASGLVRVHLMDSGERLLVSKTKKNIPSVYHAPSIMLEDVYTGEEKAHPGIKDTEMANKINIGKIEGDHIGKKMMDAVNTYVNTYIDKVKTDNTEIDTKYIQDIYDKAKVLFVYTDPSYDSIIDIKCGTGILAPPKPREITKTEYAIKPAQTNISAGSTDANVSFYVEKTVYKTDEFGKVIDGMTKKSKLPTNMYTVEIPAADVKRFDSTLTKSDTYIQPNRNNFTICPDKTAENTMTVYIPNNISEKLKLYDFAGSLKEEAKDNADKVKPVVEKLKKAGNTGGELTYDATLSGRIVKNTLDKYSRTFNVTVKCKNNETAPVTFKVTQKSNITYEMVSVSSEGIFYSTPDADTVVKDKQKYVFTITSQYGKTDPQPWHIISDFDTFPEWAMITTDKTHVYLTTDRSMPGTHTDDPWGDEIDKTPKWESTGQTKCDFDGGVDTAPKYEWTEMFGCSSSSSSYKEKTDPYADGYAFRQQKDTNPDSDTYGDTKWVRYSSWDNKCKATEVKGYPTIYIDSSAGKTIEDYTIEKIGVGSGWSDHGPKQKELPKGTIVLQVGNNVTEAHYISVKDGIIPKEIFKYAAKLTNLDSVFKDSSVSNILEGLFDNNNAVTNFSSAFKGCTGLTTIPDGLFDNNTAVTSFEGTFDGCSSLTSIPDGLFDNNIAVTSVTPGGYFGSFDSTFSGCSSLTSIPEGLFDNNTAVNNFNNTFSGCSSLTSIPEGLFDNNTAVIRFVSTFSGCSSLTSIPEGLFDNNTAVITFNNIFYDCSKLTSIPDGLFDNNAAVTSFEFNFSGCSSLTSISEGLFGNNNAVLKFWCTFNRCPNLTFIPEGLFDSNTAVTSFEGTFEGCSSLTSIPDGLFDNNIAVTNFEATFHDCKNLTGSTPTVTVKDGNRYKLWELAGKPGYAKEISGKGCFHGCTQLDDYYSIPTKWKDNPN